MAWAASPPGSEIYSRRHMTLKDRILTMIVASPDGCFIWEGARDGAGYGMVTVRYDRATGTSVTRRAHRVLYELMVGPVPDDLHLDHLCRVRDCVNWHHLEPVTPRENMRRSPFVTATIHENKTHCKYGHPLSGENLFPHRRGSKVTRGCRACARRRGAETAARRKARAMA